MTTNELKELEDPYLEKFINMVNEIWDKRGHAKRSMLGKSSLAIQKEAQITKRTTDPSASSTFSTRS